jgi:hypothetical protein
MLYPILPIFLTQILHAGGSIVVVAQGIADATPNAVQGAVSHLNVVPGLYE